MSIFGDILNKIFPSRHPAQPQVAPSASAAPAAAVSSAPQTDGPAAPPVDVEKILTDRAAQGGESLNWRTSIVDLMKLLGLDSSLESRKALAGELHYTGDTNDSATMNVWLIKQVMTQLAANGGKVPSNLMK